MFGIGMPELLLILAVALIVIGPKKLPDLARSLGKAMGEFKRATNDLKQTIEKETGLDEVRKSITETDRDIRRSFKDAAPEPPVKFASKYGSFQHSSPSEDEVDESVNSSVPDDTNEPMRQSQASDQSRSDTDGTDETLPGSTDPSKENGTP